MRSLVSRSLVLALAFCASAGICVPLSSGFDFPVGDADGGGWNTTAGWGWLEWTGSVYHPGEDWNRNGTSGDGDMGEPVFAASEGTIVAAANYGGGWGNIVLIEHRLPDGSTVWSQYAHLQQINVGSGDVGRRQQIGTVGDNFGMYDAHLHFEMRTQSREANAWVSGWSQSQIQEYYVSPTGYINARRNLCSGPTNLRWTGGPAGGRWYRQNLRLSYAVDGSDPMYCRERAGSHDATYQTRSGYFDMNYGGLGWKAFRVDAWNNCGSQAIDHPMGWCNQAPTLGWNGDSAPSGTWLRGTQYARWTWSFPYAPIKTDWYRWNGGTQYDAHPGVTQLPEGKNTLQIYCEDDAWWDDGNHSGNSSTISAEFWLDNGAPVPALTGPAISTWLNTPQCVTWTATDATSGIAAKTLTWDSGPVTTASPAQIPEGKRSATVWARDNALNEASQNFGQWWIDTTPPVPSVEFSPAAPDGENGWYTSNPTMSVVAIDPNGTDGSGVNARFYTLDGGAETPFTVPVTVSGDGIHTYSARATDVAGNSGSTGNLIVNVDTTAPVFDSIYTDTESGSLNTLVATWSCSDPDSGIAEYEYWIGMTAGDDDVRGVTSAGSNNWAYAVNLDLTPGATYYITVRARNVAGLWSGVVTSQGILAVQGGYDASPSFNSGGVSVINESRASTNYRIVDSIGQFVVASSESASFIVEHGYWHSEFAPDYAASPGAAKAIENGKTIELASVDSPVVVTSGTSTFADRFYVEALDKSSGIACQYGAAGGPALIEGDRVSLIGKLNTIAGERMIQFASPTIFSHDDPLQPLFMVVPNIGGGEFNEWTPGVLDGTGLNNVGLLVKTYGGLVSYRDPEGRFFYVDNGDNLYDGFGYGVRVVCDGFVGGGKLAMPAYGKTVIVTGISSVVMVADQPVRAIRPRRQSDIVEID